MADWRQTRDPRVERLLAQMTLEEKVGEMTQLALPALAARARGLGSAERLAQAVLQWFAQPESVAALRPRFRAIHESLRAGASQAAADAVSGLLERD